MFKIIRRSGLNRFVSECYNVFHIFYLFIPRGIIVLPYDFYLGEIRLGGINLRFYGAYTDCPFIVARKREI